MTKPNIKYRVTLSEEERGTLRSMIRHGKCAGYKIRHAQILLALDEIPENQEWTDGKIAKAYDSSMRAIGNLRKRFVEEGFEAAVGRKKREVPPVIKIDGEIEAKIVALACSEPPEGRCRWTLQLLADKVVALGYLDSVTSMSICNVLKKTKLSHGCTKSGASRSRQQSMSSGWKMS